MVALRPDDDVDDRRPSNDLLAFGLGDATRNRDQGFAALAFAPVGVASGLILTLSLLLKLPRPQTPTLE